MGKVQGMLWVGAVAVLLAGCGQSSSKNGVPFESLTMRGGPHVDYGQVVKVTPGKEAGESVIFTQVGVPKRVQGLVEEQAFKGYPLRLYPGSHDEWWLCGGAPDKVLCYPGKDALEMMR